MRSEKEMYALILQYAESDDRVRAVFLNGSRANPNVRRDKYQDFDIIFLVDNLGPFTANEAWLDYFGTRRMLQMPERMRHPSHCSRFNWMMLFEDGNRLDLTLVPLAAINEVLNDSLTVLLLDKDDLLADLPAASDLDYRVQTPAELEYASCCNNFWWCLQNVGKGLVRNEIPYAMMMYHCVVRKELHDMIAWFINGVYKKPIDSGKFGKFFKEYLPDSLYQQYLKTYSDTHSGSLWSSVLEMAQLFSTLAKAVGDAFNYTYAEDDEKNIVDYLLQLRLESK